MKPKDLLPDEINSVEKDGITIRKGTIGAFTENIKIIESFDEGDSKFSEAVSDLLELVPALQKLGFFDFYSVKSVKVRTLIQERFPDLSQD